MATRVLDYTDDGVQTVTREEVETKLTFLGLLIMQNNLKQETAAVLKDLRRCQVRTIMATGDNALTAICVGRKCTLVNPMLDIFLGELTNDGKLIWSLIKKNEHEEENLTKSEYRAFKYR